MLKQHLHVDAFPDRVNDVLENLITEPVVLSSSVAARCMMRTGKEMEVDSPQFNDQR